MSADTSYASYTVNTVTGTAFVDRIMKEAAPQAFNDFSGSADGVYIIEEAVGGHESDISDALTLMGLPYDHYWGSGQDYLEANSYVDGNGHSVGVVYENCLQISTDLAIAMVKASSGMNLTESDKSTLEFMATKGLTPEEQSDEHLERITTERDQVAAIEGSIKNDEVTAAQILVNTIANAVYFDNDTNMTTVNPVAEIVISNLVNLIGINDEVSLEDQTVLLPQAIDDLSAKLTEIVRESGNGEIVDSMRHVLTGKLYGELIELTASNSPSN